VTEAVLNHIWGTRGGLAGLYQRHDFATEKRAAMAVWAEHLSVIIAGREAAANVVALRA
jgi:hypothetical protein